MRSDHSGSVCALVATAAAFASAAAGEARGQVRQSARRIPLAYDVDVVVVGGSSHAVAAAAAAARAGAKVFLAAPKHYLGEDIAGLLRLWRDADDPPQTALGRALFAAPHLAAAPAPRGAEFTYTASLPSAGKHPDSRPPRLLRDGKYHAASTQSVQYDGDVTITCDLGRARPLKAVHLFCFQRNGDFEVRDVAVSLSADGAAWKPAGTVANPQLGKGAFEQAAIDLPMATTGTARYVRLAVRKTPRAGRVLLGEVVIETADAAPPQPAKQPAQPLLTTPMHVKATLDAALLEAGVQFLYGCLPTDVLRDGAGAVAGIVMANRAGRQAVRAKVVIDATDRATVARLAGCEFTPYPAGKHTFRQVVLGGKVRSGPQLRGRVIGRGFPIIARSRDGRIGRDTGRRASVIEYTIELPMKDGSWASFAAAEQAARDLTWNPAVYRTSEGLFEVPPDQVRSSAPLKGAFPGAAKVDLGAFRPAGAPGLLVLGPCADIPRAVAAALMKPGGMIALGERMGAAAAAGARARPAPADASVPPGEVRPVADGDVRELLTGVRPLGGGPTVPSPAGPVPVLGRYDVVVIGGGTGGAPAAIAAARKGARTLCVEMLHGLGGVSTLGLIGKYYHGYRGGFTAQIDRGVAELGGRKGAASTKVDWKMEYYRRAIRQGRGDIWFGCVGCGAFVNGRRVRGAVVATPHGRGVVLAEVVIDATGNADIAAAAGAECIHTAGDFLAVQGTGLPPWALGAEYTNTDYTFVDETDMVDIWRLFVSARRKYRGAFDLGQLIDTRERRRIRGEFVMTILDQVTGRTYPDVIGLCRTNFDTHGYTVDPFFLPAHPERKPIDCWVPYRCLIPAGWEGTLVIGLGISVHRDAVPLIRMQPDVQNVGYAAGCAAAMAAASSGMVREIDLKALQKHLVEVGCIPPEALKWDDSFPVPAERLAAAVRDLDDFRNVALVMAQKDRAIPLLKQALSAATDPAARRKYAHVLAACGDATGAAELIAAVRAAKQWDAGWNFRGMGQFGQALSPLDRYIVALGLCRAPGAVEAIVEKVRLLTAASEFSHHRACALALELIGDPAGAAALSDLLAKPGMTGHAMLTPAAGQDRSAPLREIIIARALYRLGDPRGIARKSLEQFTRDVRGHFARHAAAILQAGRKKP